MSIQPYLFFNGRCEEAIAFYGEALGAKLIMKMRFDENPQPQTMPLPEGWGSKIMHCSLQIDDATVMASDAMSATVSAWPWMPSSQACRMAGCVT